MIKVAIVDDQKLIIDGLSMMINFEEDMEIIWNASNGEEAILKLETKAPDVVLMDIRMPIMNGVEATKEMLSRKPDIKILVLTTFDEDDYVFESLKAGASGYLLKDVSPDNLIEAIKSVFIGGVVMTPEVASRVVKRISVIDEGAKAKINESLTEREIEISKLISKGMSNKEIADYLYISEGTVKNHLTSILDKLELRDRTQLAIFILKSNI